MTRFTRREMLSGALLLGAGALLSACGRPATPQAQTVAALVPATASPTRPPLDTPVPAEATEAPAPTVAAAEAATPAQQPAATEPVQAQPTQVPPEPTAVPAESAYLAAVRGASAEAITLRAIAAIGGMERFVRSGYDVIIKPNICNANHGPEYASTTNPEVVATLVKLALGAGAKRVRVMDSPFAGTAQQAYVTSGVGPAVEAAGGEMELMKAARYAESDIPEGQDLKKYGFYQPILDADLVINVPIAKHHSLARLTLAGKNLLGVIDNRPNIHRNMGQRVADLASLVRPQLTVIDAVRMLMANGPTGGNLADVQQANTVIASHDMVAADAYATTLFGKRPDEISYIVAEAAMGLGLMDLAGVAVEELTL